MAKVIKSTQADTIAAMERPSLVLMARTMASILASRQEIINRVGGNNSIIKVLRSKLSYPENPTIDDFFDLYDGGDSLATRYVEILPEMVWLSNIFVQEDDDQDEVTPFEEDFEAFAKRVNLWQQLYVADVHLGYSEYSVLFFGINDGLDPAMPANSNIAGLDSIVHVHAYPQKRATVLTKVTDINDPRVGLPLTYSITVADGVIRTVHYSRCVHIFDSKTATNSGYRGRPRLKVVYKDFIDLLKVCGGGAQSSWNGATRVTNYDVDPDALALKIEKPYKFQVEAHEQQVENLLSKAESELEETHLGLRPWALTSGITPRTTPVSVFNFGHNADSIIRRLCASLGLPWRRFIGNELGDLASTQDVDSVNKRVKSQVDISARPLVYQILTFLDQLGALSRLEVPVDELQIIWSGDQEYSEYQKAEIVDRISAANEKQVKSGEPPLLSTNEMRSVYYHLEPVDDSGNLDQGDLDSEEDLPEDLEDGDDLEETDPAAPATIEARSLAGANGYYQTVHSHADSASIVVAGIISRFWNLARNNLAPGKLRRALSVADFDRTMFIVESACKAAASQTQKRLAEVFVGLIRGVGRDITDGPLRGKRLSSLTDASNGVLVNVSLAFEMSFDSVHPRVLAWAAERSSSLITQIIASQLEASRSLIVQGIREGIPPRSLQQRIRKEIGLRADQLSAIDRLRLELMSADPGTVVKRFPPAKGLRSKAGFAAKVPNKVTMSWVNSQVKRYQSMQHNLRSRTIGRTETMKAANYGLLETWQQAQDKGLLPKTAKKIWIATNDSRCRDEHEQMNGQIRELSEPFNKPNGAEIEAGEEVGCRCTMGIVE